MREGVLLVQHPIFELMRAWDFLHPPLHHHLLPEKRPDLLRQSHESGGTCDDVGAVCDGLARHWRVQPRALTVQARLCECTSPVPGLDGECARDRLHLLPHWCRRLLAVCDKRVPGREARRVEFDTASRGCAREGHCACDPRTTLARAAAEGARIIISDLD